VRRDTGFLLLRRDRSGACFTTVTSTIGGLQHCYISGITIACDQSRSLPPGADFSSQRRDLAENLVSSIYPAWSTCPHIIVLFAVQSSCPENESAMTDLCEHIQKFYISSTVYKSVLIVKGRTRLFSDHGVQLSSYLATTQNLAISTDLPLLCTFFLLTCIFTHSKTAAMNLSLALQWHH
jgi:hypothetical protein